MKPNLLVLTPRYPYPVVGGDRLRIYQVCQALAKHFDLTLLSLCETRQEQDAPLPPDGLFCRIERVYLPKWRSWWNCILALPGSQPLQVAYYRHEGFRRRAVELMRQHDGVLAHLIRVGDAVRHESGVKFLEMTDAISLNYARVRALNGAPRDLRTAVFAWEARRLRQYEQRVVDDFDAAFLVSDIDRQFLFGDHSSRLHKVLVSSNGVALANLPYQFSEAGNTIIFIGNMRSLQNLDAAQYMAQELLPRVRANVPAARLRLVGRIPEDKARSLREMPGVEVTGEVIDVAKAALGGAVGVCPLRLGAGVQNKVLEYMALGLPTVTTSLGLEGFQAQPGHEVLVADEADAFAEAVSRLLQDRAAARQIAERARQHVEAHHGWEAVLSPLVARVKSLVTQSRADDKSP